MTKKPDEQTAGARILEARRRLGLTQTKLAAKMGLVKATIGRWEKGQYPVRDMAWHGLAEALEVSVDWLRHGKGPSPDQPPAVAAVQAVDPFVVRLFEMLEEVEGHLDHIYLGLTPPLRDPNPVEDARGHAAAALGAMRHAIAAAENATGVGKVAAFRSSQIYG